MRIALVFLPDDPTDRPLTADQRRQMQLNNTIVLRSDLVLRKLPDSENWVVVKDRWDEPGVELVGGDTAAHHVQLAVLSKLGLRKKS